MIKKQYKWVVVVAILRVVAVDPVEAAPVDPVKAAPPVEETAAVVFFSKYKLDIWSQREAVLACFHALTQYSEYPKDHKFNIEERNSITLVKISRYLKYKAYGNADATSNDLRTHGQSISLEH